MAVPDRPVNTLTWAEALVARLSLRTTGITEEDLAALKAQVGKLSTTPALPAASGEAPSLILRSARDLEQLAASLATEPAVAVDLETVGLDPRKGEVVGIGLATAAAAYYVPTGHRFEETGELLPDQVPAAVAAEALRLGDLPLVAHNAKYERKWLSQHTSITPTFVWDTMLAARLLRSDLEANLKELAMRELDVPDWDLPGKDKNRMQFLPVDRVARYCAKDVIYTLKLFERQKAWLA